MTSRHWSARHRPEQPVADDARRIDQDVERLPLFDQFVDHLVDAIGVADVGLHGADVVARPPSFRSTRLSAASRLL